MLVVASTYVVKYTANQPDVDVEVRIIPFGNCQMHFQQLAWYKYGHSCRYALMFHTQDPQESPSSWLQTMGMQHLQQ